MTSSRSPHRTTSSDSRLSISYGGFVHLDRTLALFDGTAQVEGVKVNAVPVADIGELFRRMAQFGEFDVAEMSMSTLMILISRGRQDLVGIPVFPSRSFRHGFIFVRPGSSISRPEDLRGKRVGIQHYQATAYLWMRALLQHEFNVSPQEIEWWEGGLDIASPMERFAHEPPEGVTINYLSGPDTLEGMLADERLDAIMSPEVVRPSVGDTDKLDVLIADYFERELEYFQRTGIFPIMHTVVMSRPLYRKNPWLAQRLVDLFEHAKSIGASRLRALQTPSLALPGIHQELDSLREVFGGDAFPSGFEANRETLTTMTRYAYEQGLTPRQLEVEELFAEETLTYTPIGLSDSCSAS